MAGNKQEDIPPNNINHLAVIVRDAEICYQKGQTVLSGMNISVPHGSIYCLLGSSGCGKTTLLSCILGQRKLDHGEIRIYSEKPGAKSSGVPGRNVGYMPQDVSLYPEFSMEETLFYFGGLVGIETDTISDKVKVMMNLMDLPIKRRVGTLSGGQQRLVSLAAALIHSPRLLILDEPTVGVDPILRQRLWKHMRTLVQGKGTTVIMTSHYIEECRLADFIGIIRDGRMLLEQAPNQLFLQHGSANLESIILNLCRAGTSTTAESATGIITEVTSAIITDANGTAITTLVAAKNPGATQSSTEIQQSVKRLQALTRKNITVLLRSPRLLIYNLLNQALVLIVICLALGQIPLNLGLGIVNHEAGNSTICNNVHDRCNASTLSCRFLRSIPPENFNLKMYGTEREAIAAVKTGELWGYVSLPHNFSIDFVERLLTGIYSDEKNFNNSQIVMRLDQTDAQITMSIKMLLYRAYNNFLSSLLEECGLDSRQAELPLKYRPALFGTEDTDFREFIVPGATIATLLQYACFIMSIRIIGEKKSGVLKRSTVSGVTLWEITVSNLITEIPLLFSQSIVCYLTITVLFGIQILGSHILVVFIFLLNGFTGTTAGFLMGILLEEEYAAAVLNIAIFFPTFFISGLLWPVEGMVPWLRYISPVTPCTMPGEAVRSVISRGWEYTHPNVWPGIAVPSAYTFGFIVLTSIINRQSKRM